MTEQNGQEIGMYIAQFTTGKSVKINRNIKIRM